MDRLLQRNKDASSGRPAALGSLASGHPKKETTWSPLERKRGNSPPGPCPSEPKRQLPRPPAGRGITCTLLAKLRPGYLLLPHERRRICPGCRIHAISRPHASAPPTLPSSSSARQKQIQTQSPPALLPPPTQPPWEPQSRRSCFKI